MDSLTLNDFIEYFVEVCKHFKASFYDEYISLQLENGICLDVPYDKFINVYSSSFIQTLMSCDEGGEK